MTTILHPRDSVGLRVLKGRKSRIYSVGIRPSGKVALSIEVDNASRM